MLQARALTRALFCLLVGTRIMCGLHSLVLGPAWVLWLWQVESQVAEDDPTLKHARKVVGQSKALCTKKMAEVGCGIAFRAMRCTSKAQRPERSTHSSRARRAQPSSSMAGWKMVQPGRLHIEQTPGVLGYKASLLQPT